MNINMALRAQKLSQEGLKGKAIGQKLGVTTAEANVLLVVARCQTRLKTIDKFRLTESERKLLLVLAMLEQDNLSKGFARSVESRSVAWMAKRNAGWPVATASRRIGGRHEQPRMGLVCVAGNGYLWLTELGWLVVHAIEAEAVE